MERSEEEAIQWGWPAKFTNMADGEYVQIRETREVLRHPKASLGLFNLRAAEHAEAHLCDRRYLRHSRRIRRELNDVDNIDRCEYPLRKRKSSSRHRSNRIREVDITCHSLRDTVTPSARLSVTMQHPEIVAKAPPPPPYKAPPPVMAKTASPTVQ